MWGTQVLWQGKFTKPKAGAVGPKESSPARDGLKIAQDIVLGSLKTIGNSPVRDG
jgi:hypothetical protein